MSLLRFKEAGFFFRRHLLSLTLCFFAATAPMSWLPRLGGAFWQNPLHLLLLETLLTSLATAAALLYIHSQNSAAPAAIGRCFLDALGRFGPIVLLGLLSNCLIIFGLALILPGLFLMYCFLFAEIELVLNGLSPVAALKASGRRALREHRALLPAFTALLVGIWLLELLRTALAPAADTPPGLILLLEPLANALLLAYMLPLIYRIYQCSRSATDAA